MLPELADRVVDGLRVALKDSKAPANDVESKRAKVQQQTDAQKAKTPPAVSKGGGATAEQQRAKMVNITQAKSAQQQGPKKAT
ncbi:hypothetical protein [Limnoglobus roseus]|uniref:hypothetical protein n=1 Tax=Limnoglobus roseus TaxID=2598579 RepID=UPI0011EB6648|nr:hypothetical protein [Limnoglobus roseus]